MTLAALLKWHRGQARVGADRDFHREAVACLRAAVEERAQRIERIKAGVAKARAAGKTLGRPKLNPETEKTITRLLKRGVGTKAVAAEAGCSIGSVVRIKRELGLEVGARPGYGETAQ